MQMKPINFEDVPRGRDVLVELQDGSFAVMRLHKITSPSRRDFYNWVPGAGIALFESMVIFSPVAWCELPSPSGLAKEKRSPSIEAAVI